MTKNYILLAVVAFLNLGAFAKLGNEKFSSSSGITVEHTTMEILNSETLPGNLLPNFMFQQGAIEGGSVGVKIGGGRGEPIPFIPDDSCHDDIFDGAMADKRSPQLPYLTQDAWTCDRKPENISVWILEDANLKVYITPQYDGKVWGIYDKKREKNLLFHNRAHQPANIGALKSWAAGGAEWNWSPGIIGHSAFSETEVNMGILNTELGPLLRVYEFDRYNGTTWQVDMLLYDGAFVVHPKITNPTDVDLRGYWWTCVAVDSHPATRIYAPANWVAETSRDPMRYAPWPKFAEAIENASFTGYQDEWMTDNSYIGNHQIGDMFLRIPGDAVYSPYIAHNQPDEGGFTYVHGHPLNGTKFFTWGQSGPGRFMQDFLAGGGKRQGDYTELQVGPAPTQMQNFAVPKNSVKQWTEWFKGFNADEKVMRGENYQTALNSIETWMKSSEGMDRTKVKNLDTFFEKYATKDVEHLLVQGQPWGALEEKLLGKRMVPGLKFTLPTDKNSLKYKEAQPWFELLETGKFSEETLSKMPLSYQTTDKWVSVIEKSAEKNGMTWLHALFLGISYAERGLVAEPIKYFETSINLKPNPVAYRCLAVLQSTTKDAWPYFQIAWSNLHTAWKADKDSYDRLTSNLIGEISFFLQQNLWYDEMGVFVNDVRTNNYLADYEVDAFVTMEIKWNINNKSWSSAETSLAGHCFPTYAKARDDLMSLWNTVVEGEAEEAKGSTLTNVERHQARLRNKIPDNIGCQYASEVSYVFTSLFFFLF
jgi:hypothetical protein